MCLDTDTSKLFESRSQADQEGKVQACKRMLIRAS